jgi:regulator of sigma E protease
VWGYLEPTTTVAVVTPESAAESAGILEGDSLVAFDGQPVDSWEDFQSAVGASDAGEPVIVTVERDGARIDLPATLGDRDGRGYLGIGPESVAVRLNVFQSLGESFKLTGLVFEAIVDLFNPRTFSRSVQDVRGIVGISEMAADAAHAGPLDYAGLIAMLSLSLGVMNILPLPPLDGGKVALEIVERIAGKPLKRSITIGLSAAGAVLLFSLIGYVLYADIVRMAG